MGKQIEAVIAETIRAKLRLGIDRQ